MGTVLLLVLLSDFGPILSGFHGFWKPPVPQLLVLSCYSECRTLLTFWDGCITLLDLSQSSSAY